MIHRFVLTLLSASLLFLASCSQKPAGTSSKLNSDDKTIQQQNITLALNWLPEAEHGGFYAAMLNGEYEKEGLVVEILPGGPDSPVIQRVGAKRVTFGISNADRIVLGRAQDARIVALMAPLQHSPRCIMVHEESGIESLDQLQNLTLAMSDAPAFSHFLREKLELKKVQIVRYTGSIAHFLRDNNFAQQGYVFSEPIVARREGARPKALMVSELGFNPYSSVLIAHEDLINKQPELVQRFVRASVKGWSDYLLKDSARIHSHIHSINPEMPVEVLDEGLDALKNLCLNEQNEFTGEMSSKRWLQLVEQLEQIKLLKADSIKPQKLFTLQFLDNKQKAP